MDAVWRKSTYSVANSACVEIALSADGDRVMMRDSKDPDGAVLTYGTEGWRSFIQDLREGRVRRP